MVGQDLPSLLLGAVPILLALVYLGNRCVRPRLRNVRYAQMLLMEFQTIRELVESSDDGGKSSAGMPLPRSVYDGLVASTNLSYFDMPVQKEIHTFYNLVAWYNNTVVPGAMQHYTSYKKVFDDHGGMTRLMDNLKKATDMVDEFRERNRIKGWWRLALKLVILGRDDE